MTAALLAAAVFVPTFAALRGWRVRLPWRVTVRVVRVDGAGMPIPGLLGGLGAPSGVAHDYRDIRGAENGAESEGES